MAEKSSFWQINGVGKQARTSYAIEVGARLAKARAAANLTQVGLATQLKISPQRLSNYENGEHMLPPELASLIFLRTRINSDYLYLAITDKLPSDVLARMQALEQPGEGPKPGKPKRRRSA